MFYRKYTKIALFTTMFCFSVVCYCAEGGDDVTVTVSPNMAEKLSKGKPPAAKPAKDEVEKDLYSEIAESIKDDKEEEKEIFYYQCKNIQSSSLRRILRDFITTGGLISSSDESDMIVVQDVKDNIPLLREMAEKMDRRVPQVLVEAQIVELTLDSDFEKEVKLDFQHVSPSSASFVQNIVSGLTTPGAQPESDQGWQASLRPWVKNYGNGKSSTLTSFLRYLETKGKAKILSAPNLILRRGSDGSIITGEEVPIQEQTVVSGSVTTSVKFKKVGIQLKVRPIMIRNKTVRLSVNPEVSSITGYTNNNPVIATRSATTELEVKHNEIISIGGLLKNEEREVRKRVPVAGSIPVLGHLFRATRKEMAKTQLVIFITIRILDEGVPGGVTVHRPRNIPDVVKEEISDMDLIEKKKHSRAQIMEDIDLFINEDRQ